MKQVDVSSGTDPYNLSGESFDLSAYSDIGQAGGHQLRLHRIVAQNISQFEFW